MPTTVIAKWEAEGTSDEVYIGRKRTGMHWGNPYTHREGDTLATIKVDSCEEAVRRFDLWLQGEIDHDLEPERRQWIIEHTHELKGKKLMCYGCKPCHGDVLARGAENT